jgi:hypothetical protein
MRQDITYVVNQACLHMHARRDSHWTLVKCILRYIQRTTEHGVHIIGSTDVQLRAYSDTD